MATLNLELFLICISALISIISVSLAVYFAIKTFVKNKGIAKQKFFKLTYAAAALLGAILCICSFYGLSLLIGCFHILGITFCGINSFRKKEMTF